MGGGPHPIYTWHTAPFPVVLMVSIPSPEQAFTLLGTNKALLSRWFFLFPMWDMLVPWKVGEISFAGHIWIYLGSVGSVCHVGSASGWPAGPSSMIAWIFLPWTCWCRAVGLDIINIRSVELDYITGWNWNLENIELTHCQSWSLTPWNHLTYSNCLKLLALWLSTKRSYRSLGT